MLSSPSLSWPLKHLPWAKFQREDGQRLACHDGQDQFLPLIRHMLDVAATFLELVAQPLLRQRLETAAEQPLNDIQLHRLAFIAALHDFGKLCPGFQFKIFPSLNNDRSGHVLQGWDLFSSPAACQQLHQHLSTWLEGETLAHLLLASLNHHGKVRVSLQDVPSTRAPHHQPYAGYDPAATATRLVEELLQAFPEVTQTAPSLPETPRLQHFFCGLVTLADQIGSRENDFPVTRPPLPPHEAREDSHNRARKALALLGMDVSAQRSQLASAVSPAELFGWPEGAAPKAMQTQTAAQNGQVVVLESETGSGKTEAALLRFKALFEAGEVDALYFAVPTRAAASALQKRVNHASVKLFGRETVLAVPGYVRHGTHEIKEHLPNFRVLWDDEVQNQPDRWAAESSRHFLAAPVAVGTIDQAMMAIMHVKWAHLRATTLSRALLVVDEVHASDVYMTEIGRRLVNNHLALGGHALLMSATLGAQARAEWLGLQDQVATPENVPYPCLTVKEKGHEHHQALPLPENNTTKTVSLSTQAVLESPEKVARLALEAARQGLRVLVIRNTVSEAVRTFEALESADPQGTVPTLEVNGIRTLHHSRFAPEDRKALDEAVENLFGKHADPKTRGVVIGTQTLEQSLDIDADLLITDLCPVDVLLQRIGRLHRHKARPRPQTGEQARCIVLVPEKLQPEKPPLRWGMGCTHEGEGVYVDLRMLAALQALITQQPEWTIPAQNRQLVEAGTDPAKLDALGRSLDTQEGGTAWQDRSTKVVGTQITHREEAVAACYNPTQPLGLKGTQAGTAERFRTRLGLDSLNLPFSPVAGPLGTSISSLNIPHHMAQHLLEALKTGQEQAASPHDIPQPLCHFTPFSARDGHQALEIACSVSGGARQANKNFSAAQTTYFIYSRTGLALKQDEPQDSRNSTP